MQEVGNMPKRVGDKPGLDLVPGLAVVMFMDVRSWTRFPLPEAVGNAAESLDRAEERVVVGAVADDFAAYSVLLVGERECR